MRIAGRAYPNLRYQTDVPKLTVPSYLVPRAYTNYTLPANYVHVLFAPRSTTSMNGRVKARYFDRSISL